MAVAYLIRAHHRPEQLVRLVERLASPSASFFVHVDGRAPASVYEAARAGAGRPRRRALGDRGHPYYSGFSLVRSVLAGLEEIERTGRLRTRCCSRGSAIRCGLPRASNRSWPSARDRASSSTSTSRASAGPTRTAASTGSATATSSGCTSGRGRFASRSCAARFPRASSRTAARPGACSPTRPSERSSPSSTSARRVALLRAREDAGRDLYADGADQLARCATGSRTRAFTTSSGPAARIRHLPRARTSTGSPPRTSSSHGSSMSRLDAEILDLIDRELLGKASPPDG